MRYEQKKTMSSLAREQQLNQRYQAQSSPPPAATPPQDDELSLMDDKDHEHHLHPPRESLWTLLISELVGTYILVLIGCGAACASFYGNKNNDGNVPTSSWNVPLMWAIGAMLGIYSAASISGGHLNPAITLAFSMVRPSAFSPSKVLPYWMAQVAGATLAALTIIFLFHQAMLEWEERHFANLPSKCQTITASGKALFVFGVKSHIKGCQPYDERQLQSMSAFAGFWSQLPSKHAVANVMHATCIEAFGTAFVVFIIFSVTSSLYPIPGPAVPPVVALALGAMMYLLSPLTGDHLNPANELGRRLAGMIWLTWGQEMNFNELRPLWQMMWSDVTPYVVGPLIGGPLGAWIAETIQPIY